MRIILLISLMLVMSGCICFTPKVKQEIPKEIMETTTTTLTPISIDLGSETANPICEVNQTQETIYYYETIYNRIDLTKQQEKEILNLRPQTCFTQGCNIGFYEAKRLILELLDFDVPQFQEHTGLGYNPFFKFDTENITCFNQKYDDYGSGYISLSKDYWRVWEMNNSFMLVKRAEDSKTWPQQK